MDLLVVAAMLFLGFSLFALWFLKSILDAFMMMFFYWKFLPVQAVALGALVWALGFWPGSGLFLLCFWVMAFVRSECYDVIQTFLLDREQDTV